MCYVRPFRACRALQTRKLFPFQEQSLVNSLVNSVVAKTAGYATVIDVNNVDLFMERQFQYEDSKRKIKAKDAVPRCFGKEGGRKRGRERGKEGKREGVGEIREG